MSEPFIGTIQAFGFNFAPRGWAQCDGQLLPIAQYSALFSLLGTTYGGDGRTTFALPDLRGRVPMHTGQGPGLSVAKMGQKGGAETVTLTNNQIPAHTHTATAGLHGTSADSENDEPTDAALAKPSQGTLYAEAALDAPMAAGSVTVSNANTGGGQPHENRQPYLVVNYCIALQGLFPSRN